MVPRGMKLLFLHTEWLYQSSLLILLLVQLLTVFSFSLVWLIKIMTLTILKHGELNRTLLGTLSMCVWAPLTLKIPIDITCSRLAFYQRLSRMFLLYALEAAIPIVQKTVDCMRFLWSPTAKRLWSLSALPKMEEWSMDPTTVKATCGSLVTWTSAMAEEKETLTTMFLQCFIPISWAAGALVAKMWHSEPHAQITVITTALSKRMPWQFPAL